MHLAFSGIYFLVIIGKKGKDYDPLMYIFELFLMLYILEIECWLLSCLSYTLQWKWIKEILDVHRSTEELDKNYYQINVWRVINMRIARNRRIANENLRKLLHQTVYNIKCLFHFFCITTGVMASLTCTAFSSYIVLNMFILLKSVVCSFLDR